MRRSRRSGGEPLSAMSEVKINTVLQHGGFSCVALTVEQLTGVKIPAGGIVEFDGVAALATAVGGVEVCLAERIDDDYSGPAPRCRHAQHLRLRRARVPPVAARRG